MQSLDAALAFAITMLVLSMVVTTLVETLHRFLRLRENGLELLLGNFYDRVVARRGTAPPDPAMRLAFIQAMTANRAPAGDTFLSRIWAGGRLGELGVQPFMERLGGTSFGATIVNNAAVAGEQAIAQALKDVSQKFEAFGREASVYFEARARLVSVIVGIVLAFAVNVNAFALFDTFMRQPDVAEAVIKRGSEVQKAFERLKESANEVDTSAKPDPANGAAGSRQSADEARKAMDEARQQVDQAVKSLSGVGVPIGWSPAAFRSATTNPWAITYAFFGLLLGGLLVGLGAPFWYNAVRGLTNIRTLIRGRAAEPAAAQAHAAGGAERLVAQPQTPVEAFVAARAAADLDTPLRPPEEPVG
jgi:hypothetical protein